MDNVFEGLNTSDRIRGILASRKKTQGELATLLKMTPETISARMKLNKWEVEELTVIGKEFNVDPKDLI